MNRVSYIHCTRCCAEASPSCLKHKQLIEIFYGTEIEKLRRRKQYECKFCFKIGYSSSERIICRFCRSRNIKVLNWYIPNKCAWSTSLLEFLYKNVNLIRINIELIIEFWSFVSLYSDFEVLLALYDHRIWSIPFDQQVHVALQNHRI